MFKKIKSIIYIGKKKTYDLSVEDNHNFLLANNLLSHNSEDLLGICEMPSPSSREVTCTPLKKDRRMNPHQIRYIATMPIYQICVVARGQNAKILKRIQPPRCRYWKDNKPGFYTIWKDEVDVWTNTSHFIDIMEKEYKDRDVMIAIKKMDYQEVEEIKVETIDVEQKKEEAVEEIYIDPEAELPDDIFN